MSLLLLALLPTAHANNGPTRTTITIPLVKGTGSWKRDQPPSPGLTGNVTVSDPNTDEPFTWTGGELTVSGRSASGTADLAFAASPAGSIRTWAVWYVGYDGQLLGDPEIVDVLFDDLGNGEIAARSASGNLTRISVRGGDFAGARTRVAVADAGADAAWIGISELTNDTEGAALLADPDMDQLDLVGYAAWLEHGFDAIVPIEDGQIVLSGDFAVSDFDIVNGIVHGGADLRWDIELVDGVNVRCEELGVCTETPNVVDQVSYLAPVGPLRGKKGVLPPLKLRPADQTFDSWDAGIEMTFEALSVAADLELSGLLTATSKTGSATAETVTLDPSSFGVQATGTADISALGDVSWASLADQTFGIDVRDPGGYLVGTHVCTMAPTAGTLAGTARVPTLVGECTSGTDTHVRRLRARIDGGTLDLTVDMAGAAFAQEIRSEDCLSRVCVPTSYRVRDGEIAVSVDGMPVFAGAMTTVDTTFTLPFAFASDVAGSAMELEVEVFPPDGVTMALIADETVGVYRDGLLTESFACEDLGFDAVGTYTMKGNVPASCGTFPRIRRVWY